MPPKAAKSSQTQQRQRVSRTSNLPGLGWLIRREYDFIDADGRLAGARSAVGQKRFDGRGAAVIPADVAPAIDIAGRL
jgi:hypothetical protein